MPPGERFVFESELLFKANGEQFVREVRTIFRELEAESRRLISQGTTAGISPRYAAAQGQIASIIANKPGLSERQQNEAFASLRGSNIAFARLQRDAVDAGLVLRSISSSGVDRGFEQGSRLIREALHRQSIAKLREAEAADKLAAAERRAATEVERRTTLDAQRGTSASRVPAGAALRYTIGGLGLTPAQLAAANRGVTGEPDPTQSRYSLGGLGIRPSEMSAINRNLAALRVRETVTEEESLREEARLALAKRARAANLARITREEATRQGLGGGTFFQRLQSSVHARGGFGGGGDSRLPSEFQSFGQFLTSKAVTTGGFALSGAILYGAIAGFKELVREASALQRELAVIKPQFDALGDSEGFTRFARRVTEIGVSTGVAANEVAHVARQLAGVFRDPTNGAADFNRALNETTQALKLAQVTGLPFQEITDSLTAITTTFGTSFTTIGDLAIGLEERFGVLAPQLITFAADVAPVAKELGFTIEQITALGAIAQQRSGVSGGALAENFNRALPSIQKAQVAIAQLLSQRTSTTAFVDPVISALGQGQGAKVIEELTKAYGQMSRTQRQALGDLLGGERNAKAFFAVLQGGQDTIKALGDASTGQFGGALEKRFSDFQSTVEFAFARAQRALEQFGLALFNSGLADGLKLVADSGADVARVAGLLLRLFSEFNDTLGGLPVKLLAVYTTLKLISALGGGVGGIRNLITGLSARGAVAATGPAFASPFNAAAFARPVAGVGAGGARAALGGIVAGLAPAIATLAVASIAQTVSSVNDQIVGAQRDLSEQVSIQIKAGVSQGEIIRRAQAAGAFGSATNSLQRDVELKILSFGTADTTSPGDKIVDDIQKANAERQVKELEALARTLDEKDRKEFQGIIELFKADPANNELNDVIARIIDDRRRRGTPGQVAALAAIADEYGGAARSAADLKEATDFEPVLDDIRARYETGNAALSELIEADRRQLEIFRKIMENVNASQEARREAAQKFAQQQKTLDNDITSAARRAAEITTRLATLRGDDVATATLDAKLLQLQTVIAQGASPDVVLDSALDVLDAQQKKLEEFINSPVVVNGISRGPNAAEKLARSQQGLEISPEVRSAIIKAQLSTGANLDAVKGLALAKGVSISQAIDLVTNALMAGDQGILEALTAAIDAQIENLRKFAQSTYFKPDKAAVDRAIAGLNQAKSLLGKIDPGPKVKGSGIAGLAGQSQTEASNEAKAYADALIAQQRAQAHGDPIATAQAAIAAAQNAIRYAGTPSERAAAVAQLIDAQNQLQDAQIAALESAVSLTQARTSDPVARAQIELQKVQAAIDNAHGVAARNDALARQAEAQRTLNDAITDVFRSQQELVAAIADAAGDVVASAEAQLAIAQRNLNDLLARRAGGDDPGEAAINRARAQVEQSQAAVRDAELNQRSQDIDIALQLERITTAQAIAQFQALLQIPNLTVQETNQILLKIKQLKDSLSQDFASNIPSEIHVPSLYEARRLRDVATPGGPQSYQDNRNIVINLEAYNQGDLTEAVDTIVGAVESRPRNGSRPGNY